MFPILSAGALVDSLTPFKRVSLGRQRLAVITVETGAQLCCSPETAFGLHVEDGKVLLSLARYMPTLYLGTLLDDVCYQDIGPRDVRLWYLAGMMLANGKVTGNTARPARITFKNRGESEVASVAAMLHAYAHGVHLRDKTGRPYQVLIKPHHGGVDISSAILDHMNQILGGFIAPVTMKPQWGLLFASGADALHAFMAGLVRNMDWSVDGARFLHTSAEVVRMVHSRLYWTFGIPARLSISPHEPETVTHKVRTAMPHHLVVQTQDLGYLKRSHLWPADRPPPAGTPPLLYPAAITKVEVVEDEAVSIESSPPQALVIADGFLLQARFEPHPLALDIATMQELFVPEPRGLGAIPERESA